MFQVIHKRSFIHVNRSVNEVEDMLAKQGIDGVDIFIGLLIDVALVFNLVFLKELYVQGS